MYCPQCHTEYRRGFTECADCRLPLVPQLPAEHEPPLPPGSPNPAMDIVAVCECENPVELAWAESVLEEAGIPYNVAGETAAYMFLAEPARQGTWLIQVGRDRAGEAVALLEPLEDAGKNPSAENPSA